MTYDGPRFSMPSLSPAIKLLMIVNCAVFVANMLLVGRLSEPTVGGGGMWFAFSWSGMFDGYGLGCLRVLTYQFTHSFQDPMHLLMNMMVLWFFGPQAEARLGSTGTIRLYLWGGAVGALMHLAITSLQGAVDVPVVGASGACFALLLYAAFMAPHATVILVLMPVPQWMLAAFFVGIGVYSTFVEFATGYAGGISHGAHLGGALLGTLAYKQNWFLTYGGYGTATGTGWFASLRDRWRASRAAHHAAAAAHDEQQLEDILTKIKVHGLGSLTAGERRFLEQQSEQARQRR